MIILSINGTPIFDTTMYNLFEYSNLTWIVQRESKECVDATALWLSVSMVILSLSLMLGTELLIKRIELNREINKNKVKQPKKKGPVIKKIKY